MLLIAIPLVLTGVRLLLGPIAIALAISEQPRLLLALLLLLGLLTDIFDGVLARRLGVSRVWLRRFDSLTDILFYSCIFVSAWITAHAIITKSVPPLLVVAASEIVCIVASLIRFRAMPATHSYAAKIYGLAIFAAFFAAIAFGVGPWSFWLLAAIALVTNIEILLIIALSRAAPVDIPSIFHLKRRAAVAALWTKPAAAKADLLG